MLILFFFTFDLKIIYNSGKGKCDNMEEKKNQKKKNQKGNKNTNIILLVLAFFT